MTKNTWLYVPVKGACHRERLDFQAQLPRVEQLLGSDRVDFGSFTRRFGYVVYEHSITDGWPLNFRFRSGNDQPDFVMMVDGQTTEFRSPYAAGVDVRGPCLIFKNDDQGETVDLEQSDIDALMGWITNNRLGLLEDAMRVLS